MIDPIIRLNQVDFQYKTGQKILKNISLDIYKGEFLAFVGQNGAGKTTCAKLINGILRPTIGAVYVNGISTLTVPSSQIARTVGYCYQNPDHQIWAMKVEEELSFGPRNLGLSQSEVKDRIEHALEIAGLVDQQDSYTFSLGWGQRQKLAVASILAMQPQVIIVDEPTTGLDWQGSVRIMELLKELNKSGLTVVIITHDMEIVTTYTQRVIVFSDGQVIKDGLVEDVMYDPQSLTQAGLRPPQFIRIALGLKAKGFPQRITSISEFKSNIFQSMNKESSSAKQSI